MPSLRELEHRGDYLTLIREARSWVKADRRAFTDPALKLWCERRFRNIFLTEIEKDPAALAEANRASRQKDPSSRPPRQRLSERFLKHCGVTEWQAEMPEVQMGKVTNTTLVFCPGLFTGLIPIGAFQAAFPVVEREVGLRILRADAHPVRGCEANMADLLDTIHRGIGHTADLMPITEATAIPPKDVFLIGYSKGAVDALTLLAHYPELKDRVRCVFNWAGAIGGSYIADDIYGAIKDISIPLGPIGEPITSLIKIVAPVVRLDAAARRLSEYDLKAALRDLTTATRAAFLAERGALLDSLSIPFFNLTGATTLLEVPYFQAQGVIQLNRHDPDNDMQLIQAQAKLPLSMATDLAVFRANHWDLSYDAFPENQRLGSSNLDHPFPKKAAVIAMFKFAAELGLID